jgi:flagellar hook-associated protein 2
MASITSLGTGSGIDLEGMVRKLMAVESQPLNALAAKEAGYQAKLSAYGSLSGALSSLQSAAKTLATAGTFTGKTVSVSDTMTLTATVNSSATPGTHSISVTQLAKFNAVRSNVNYAATTDTFTTGTLSIQTGSGTPVDITIDSSNNSLAGIRDAINQANAGVTASIINDGTTNRLVLTSKSLGTDGAITVTAADSTSGGTHALSGLASANLVTTQAADNAMLSVDGVGITRSSNTISDAVDGLTLNLLKGSATTPATANVSVVRDLGTVTSAVSAFVKAYNSVISQAKSLTAYDAVNKKASLLTGDNTVRDIQARLSGLRNNTVSGVGGGVSRLSDLGIAVQVDGTLATDNAKLQKALNDPAVDVAALFGSTATGNAGIATRLSGAIDGMINSQGIIKSRTDGINTSIKNLQDRADAMNLRLAAIEKRYRAQFAAMDKLVSGMNQTSTYLSQQLASLANLSGNSR